MSPAVMPAGCDRLAALIDDLGEDTPDRVVTHTILTHLAACRTCCQAEAALTRLLADYHFAAGDGLPLHLAERLVREVCGPDAACEEGMIQ